MTKCSKTACIISTLAVFITMTLFEFLVHGHLLSGLYQQTASLWRPMEEMVELKTWNWLHTLLLSGVFACAYKCVQKGRTACAVPGEKAPCPTGGGLCFGVGAGLILGLTASKSYAWLPIPMELAVYWFMAGFIEGLLIGLVLCLINRKCAATQS